MRGGRERSPGVVGSGRKKVGGGGDGSGAWCMEEK